MADANHTANTKRLTDAARAAGFAQVEWLVEHGEQRIRVKDGESNWHWWEPLVDDGDAFRLAVRCGMHLCFDPETHCMDAQNKDTWHWHSKSGKDHRAAARLAIVCAAAELGRKMK